MASKDDSGSLPTKSSTETPGNSDTLEWTTHPMKRRPVVAVILAVFILTVSFVVLATTDSQWFGFLALVVLFASVAKFYFPTQFRLSESGVTIKSTTQTINKQWNIFRSYYPDKNGVLLSPFAEPSRLENFRGQYLMFEHNRDDVIAFIGRYVGKSAIQSEGRKS